MDETLSDIARLRRDADRCSQLAAEATDANDARALRNVGACVGPACGFASRGCDEGRELTGRSPVIGRSPSTCQGSPCGRTASNGLLFQANGTSSLVHRRKVVSPNS